MDTKSRYLRELNKLTIEAMRRGQRKHLKALEAVERAVRAGDASLPFREIMVDWKIDTSKPVDASQNEHRLYFGLETDFLRVTPQNERLIFPDVVKQLYYHPTLYGQWFEVAGYSKTAWMVYTRWVEDHMTDLVREEKRAREAAAWVAAAKMARKRRTEVERRNELGIPQGTKLGTSVVLQQLKSRMLR